MVAADHQHRDTAQCHQGIGHEIERQGVDEQQHDPAHAHQQHLAAQQPVKARRVARCEEVLGEVQPCQPRQDQRKVRRWRLGAVPHMPPWAAEVQQDQAAEQHQAMVERQDQGSARAAVDEANQVMQDQHHQATEQHAEQQRLGLIGGGARSGLKADGRAQLVFRYQAQVDIQALLAVGQRQHVVAAAQCGVGTAGVAAVMQVAYQLVALQGV